MKIFLAFSDSDQKSKKKVHPSRMTDNLYEWDVSKQQDGYKTQYKLLARTSTFLDSVAPLGKKIRVTYEAPVESLFKVYRGNSSQGPCLFYHHVATDTWILLCRNQHRRKRRLLPILTEEMSRHPLVCSTIRNVLGNPMVLPAFKASSSASEDKSIQENTWDCMIPGFSKAMKKLHDSASFFQKWAYNDLQCVGQDVRQLCDDGDLIWAVWYPRGDLRQKVREQLPYDIAEKIFSMVGEPGDLSHTGFTGFFKIDLILECGGTLLRCRRNSNFWARRIEGPTHYWEEDPLDDVMPPEVSYSSSDEEGDEE
jgi:hypothetical protein